MVKNGSHFLKIYRRNLADNPASFPVFKINRVLGTRCIMHPISSRIPVVIILE